MKPNIPKDSDEKNISTLQNDILPMQKVIRSLMRKQQRAMRKINCSMKGCPLKFACNETKLRHEDCHAPNMKHYECPQCRQKFSLWRLCSKHLWTCHKIDAGLCTCSMCDKYKSYSPVALMTHMGIHYTEKPFICQDCGKGFEELSQLRNHDMIHKKDEEVACSEAKKCTICDRIFANEKSLKKHIQSIHDKLKPFTCNICGHKTTRKSILELHLRQHTGDKPHQCPHCTYRTGDRNCMRKHMMKHYGKMQYYCPHCKYQSIQSSAYKYHLLTKHPDAKEIFKCTECAFTSVNFDSHLTHVKCHEYNAKKRQTGNSTEDAVVNMSISANITKNSEIQMHLSDDADDLEET